MKEFIFVFVAKLLKKYYNKIIYEEESYEKNYVIIIDDEFYLGWMLIIEKCRYNESINAKWSNSLIFSRCL